MNRQRSNLVKPFLASVFVEQEKSQARRQVKTQKGGELFQNRIPLKRALSCTTDFVWEPRLWQGWKAKLQWNQHWHRYRQRKGIEAIIERLLSTFETNQLFCPLAEVSNGKDGQEQRWEDQQEWILGVESQKFLYWLIEINSQIALQQW